MARRKPHKAIAERDVARTAARELAAHASTLADAVDMLAGFTDAQRRAVRAVVDAAWARGYATGRGVV